MYFAWMSVLIKTRWYLALMSIFQKIEKTKKWNLLRLKNITSAFIRKQGMSTNHGL